MTRTNTERLKVIQRALNVEDDGVLGAETLTALEKKLHISQAIAHTDFNLANRHGTVGLTLTRAGIQKIIEFEIGSIGYYRAKLAIPTWPGGDSGVTIGIGYDLGYQTEQVFKTDWARYIPSRDLNKLANTCGKKGRSARVLIRRFARVLIPFEAANEVFINTSLPVYAEKTKRVFSGVEKLSPNAQTALVSLVYNRGTSISGSSRSEMLAIRQLVPSKNYLEIANKIEQMKRLWVNRGLDGLLKRRDIEAAMVREGERLYEAGELVAV